jgi:hypothetical protein
MLLKDSSLVATGQPTLPEAQEWRQVRLEEPPSQGGKRLKKRIENKQLSLQLFFDLHKKSLFFSAQSKSTSVSNFADGCQE